MPESVKTRDADHAAPPPQHFEPPSLWRLMRAHKRATGAGLGIVVLLVAVVLLADFGSRVTRITDSTSCTVWSSSNQTEQAAYAALYVKEHGPLPSGGSNVSTIEAAINAGCTNAFGYDEADAVTVLQSIRRQY